MFWLWWKTPRSPAAPRVPQADITEAEALCSWRAGRSPRRDPYPDFIDWQTRAHSFDDLAAIASSNWSGTLKADQPLPVLYRAVSGNFSNTTLVKRFFGLQCPAKCAERRPTPPDRWMRPQRLPAKAESHLNGFVIARRGARGLI
jgi:hypothetical protein